MSTWISKLAALILLLPLPAAAETLKVAPPSGYCIDNAASGQMMVMGRCAGGSGLPAVLTVMPGAAGSASSLANRDAVARFLTTEAGRAALSRRGRAADVTVAEMRGRGDALLIRLRDHATTGESWRILVPLAGRMVTLTVTTTGAGNSAQTLALAERFLAAMRQSNAE